MIEKIRKIRCQVSQRFGHDTCALIARYCSIETKYANQIVREPAADYSMKKLLGSGPTGHAKRQTKADANGGLHLRFMPVVVSISETEPALAAGFEKLHVLLRYRGDLAAVEAAGFELVWSDGEERAGWMPRTLSTIHREEPANG